MNVRVPHEGDPDMPVLGECRECGPDHYVIDGMCVGDCETCALSREDAPFCPGEALYWSPCARKNYDPNDATLALGGW